MAKTSIGLTDQVILCQIYEASKSELEAPAIRVIGKWLSVRHETNMSNP